MWPGGHGADASGMTNIALPSRVGGHRRRLGRAVGCAAAAALLMLGMPTPAAAAPTPSVTVADVVVSEAAGTASFRIRVSPRPRTCCSLQVDWATADGTATAPADYAPSSGTVTLTRNAPSVVVTVPIASDCLFEPNERFTVNLSNLVGTPGKIGDAQALGTITDDGAAAVNLSIDDVTVGEGDVGTTTASFTATLSAACGTPVSVDWSTMDGSAVQPGDYISGSGTLLFAAGDTTEVVDVAVNGDVELEADEEFTVELTGPVNATVSDGFGTGTIVDDELAPVVSINDAAMTEGEVGTSTLSFTVELSRPGAVPATVDWATSDGTASQPSDYLSAASTVTFPAGDVSEPVDVTINGDAVFEFDETFVVDLSNPVDATMGDPQGEGTISNDDASPSIAITDDSVSEGNAGSATATFDVTLSEPSGAPATVEWATADGTALAGPDYVAGSGTVSFAVGDVTESLSVTVNGDTTDEPSETFDVHLSSPTGAAIADASGVGTIVDDDRTPTTLTLRVRKRPLRVIGTGLLEPAKAGFQVSVSLLRRRANGTYVRLRTKTVQVTNIRDRDLDGMKEGAYRATFSRPTRAGTYRMVARFNRTATHEASVRRVTFSLS
jgi:hypothetical protein